MGTVSRLGGEADLSLALLEQAGMAAYERDPKAQHFLLWLTKPEAFAGGALPAAAVAEHDYHQRLHPADAEQFQKTLNAALKNDGVYRLDYRLTLADGHMVWVQDAGRVEYSPAGLPLKARGVITFLEPYMARAEAAEFAASFDALTGRPNRMAFQRDVSAMIARQASGALLVVSIDNMTWLNEAIGPSAADDLLLAATQRLDRLVPDSAVLARIGGDSFGVWLPAQTATALDETAQEILQNFRDQHFATLECAVHISVSVGAVLVPQHASNGIEALTRAEQALKAARAVGRSSYRLYEPNDDRRGAHLASLSDIERVRKALAQDEFVLAFQPIVRANTGQIAFHEALLRLRKADGTYESVFKYIVALEAHGLSQEIDRYVLGLATQALRDDTDLRLSVNISGATASDPLFQKFLNTLLGADRAIAERMIFEITELAAINDLAETSRFVSTVHALGGRVALDDYGEGFTALQHLLRLKVDMIKIDGNLIKGITEKGEQQVMVKAILSMAQHMGIETVAEFVETEKEAAWLQRHGAALLQGYFFGKAEIPEQTGRAVDKEISNDAARSFLMTNTMLTLAI